jgi:hypothetical protein
VGKKRNKDCATKEINLGGKMPHSLEALNQKWKDGEIKSVRRSLLIALDGRYI